MKYQESNWYYPPEGDFGDVDLNRNLTGKLVYSN